MDKFLYAFYNNQSISAVVLIAFGAGIILGMASVILDDESKISMILGTISVISVIVVPIIWSGICIFSDNKVNSDFDKLAYEKTYTVLSYRKQIMHKKGDDDTYYLIKTKGHGEMVISNDDKYFVDVDEEDRFADKKHKPGTATGTYTETTFNKNLPRYQRKAFENKMKYSIKETYFKLKVINYESKKVESISDKR